MERVSAHFALGDANQLSSPTTVVPANPLIATTRGVNSAQEAMPTLPAADGRSGYCAATRTFRSLRPAVPLPPPSLPLSFPSFAFALLPSLPPDRTAFVDAAAGAALSYSDFASRVRLLASSLQRRFGLVHGNVALVLAPASIDIPVLYFALLCVGAVIAPVNPLCTPSEILHLLRLSRPTVAFATSAAASKLPQELHVVLIDSEMFQSCMRRPDGDGEDEHSASEITVRQSDTAALQFSSGTTGRVKAAAVAHRSLIARVAGWHALRPPGHQTTLLSAPMFHTMGFLFVLKSVALRETGVVLPPKGGGGVEGMLRVAEQWSVTQMIMAPPAVVAMAKADAAGRLPKLQRVVCGGAPMPPAAAERFHRIFPHVELQMGYGSTEGGSISRMNCREECSRLRSAGRISPNVKVKIVDHSTGEALPVGREGEFRVRGPSVMKGYVGDAEANADAFDTEGWLKTGDLGFIDQDGFLFVVDRLKELIKYKAYQVAPAELEYILLSHPGIADVAVAPFPHEETGQIPVALVVRKPGNESTNTVTEEQVIDFVAKQVAPYKKIRKVVFVESIPKSPSGKILRRQLLTLTSSIPSSRL